MKFGAIDIGSNAIRLLIASVLVKKQGPLVKKDTLVRVPIRLGEEAFIDSRISDLKVKKLLQSLKAFRLLMDVHDVIQYRACATSVMREASNRGEIISRIKSQCSIDLELISGIEESKLVFENFAKQSAGKKGEAFLSIDVGGGSTETLLFSGGKIIEAQSWKIGTLRLLNDQVKNKRWKEMRMWLKQVTANFQIVYGIGSGGNIIRLKKMYGPLRENYLPATMLKGIYEHLNSFTMAERIHVLGLKPDRADVIIPATEIFKKVCSWASVKKYMFPSWAFQMVSSTS